MTRRRRPRTRRELAGLTLLAALAPIVWVLSDLAVTGDALWSLTNTRHTAHLLGRVTGIGNVPQYIPRRIGEILRPPVLVGAALGGVLSLLWLRRRALIGAVAGRRRGRRVRRRRGRGAADQHPLRLPGGGDPVRLLRRGRIRLDAPGGGRSAPTLVDRRRGARAPRADRLRAGRSTARRTANWTNSRASSASKTTWSRSSTTARSPSAAARSACPTTRPCPCSRCT